MIGYVEGENHATQFLVNHEGARDKQIQSVGVAQHGSDAVLTLRRAGGRYSLTSENLGTGESVTLTTTHPAFLEGIADMQVGVFGANTRTKESRTVIIKELQVMVWTKVVGTGRPVRMAGAPSTKTTDN